MTSWIAAAALVATLVLPAQAQVRIDIGINLPGPPSLVIVPGTPVYAAVRAPVNVFLYGHQYWAFVNGAWHVGPNWNGPWVLVEPVYVPVPVLKVPVRYYPVPPGHWRAWRRDAPPRWEPQYGRGWREEPHERSWRESEERWQHGDDRGRGRGKGHGKNK
jgi:hypothetical protein